MSYLPTAVSESVSIAWQNNLALKERELEVEVAASRLAEVKSVLQPRLDLLARYTRADGGRTIDLPLGDLLNGAYATLNDFLRTQGRPAAFPSLQNQSIALLRPEEQETKLRATQVLWRPELTRLTRASRHGLRASEAQVAAYRQELAQVVAATHLQALAAEAGVAVWRSALALTAEAQRVNEVLFRHEKATEDAVLRAEAEHLQLEQRLLDAERDAHGARRQLNFLLNREVDAPLAAVAEEEVLLCIRNLDTRWSGRPTLGKREELVALEAALAASADRVDAVRARLQPTVALAVEGGLQGESYRLEQKASYVQGSLVAEVNLWDGRGRREQLAQAVSAHRQLELQRRQVESQLQLQLAQAWDEWLAARAGMVAAERRRDAARRAFEMVSRREREGVANALAFLDARQEHTAADLAGVIAHYRLLIAANAVARAAGEAPLSTIVEP